VLKRVKDGEQLLVKNTIRVDDKTTNDQTLQELIYQQTNGKLMGIPLRLHIYNLAREQRDSIFEAWLHKNPKRIERLEKIYSKKQVDKIKESALGFNKWLKKTGEAPVIIDTSKTKKTVKRLRGYYFNHGWFNADVDYKITKTGTKRASVEYIIKKGEPYFLDSINYTIKTPAIDSLFSLTKAESFIKEGEQYNDDNLNKEISRVTNQLRNSGVYNFKKENIEFEFDTINTGKKVITDYIINNRSTRKQDSIYRTPFKIYTIKDVNIVYTI